MSSLPNSIRLAWRNLRVNTDPGSLVIIFGLPLMYLVFWGTFYAGIVNSFSIGGVVFSYRTYIEGGILAFETVMAGTMGGSMLWADRRFGMFSQILSGPFTRTQYLWGVILSTVAAALLGSLVLIVVSVLLGGAVVISLVGIGLVFFSLLVGGIFFCSLLLFISAKVKSNQTYNSVQILVIFIVSFISDAYYPMRAPIPAWLQIISFINPLSYITDGVRAGLVSPANMLNIINQRPILNSSLPWEPILLLVETIATFAVAYWTYANVKVNAT